MALRTPVVLAPLFLEDHDRSSAALVDDFRRHLGTLDQRLSDEEAFVSVDQPHIAEFHLTADIAWEAFDLERRAAFDSILPAACFHYCIHEYRLRDQNVVMYHSDLKGVKEAGPSVILTPFW